MPETVSRTETPSPLPLLQTCGELRARPWLRGRNIAPVLRGIVAVALISHSAAAQASASVAEDRARLATLVGDTVTPAASGSVQRWVDARLGRIPASDRVAFRVVLPDVRVTWNSAIPFSVNDGPLWAGRGWNMSVTAGVGGEGRIPVAGRPTVRVVLAPTLTYSQNLPVQILPNYEYGRSLYSNPLHRRGASLDYPMRFGDLYLLRVDPGRSDITLSWRRVAAGVTTANEWWGPGMRNALVMSSNAPGIPRLFVRTSHPLSTRLGLVDAELFGGTLTQSMFFGVTSNENRTISGIRAELRPAFDTMLTLGLERVVYAEIGPYASPGLMTLSRSLDALIRWEQLRGPGLQKSDQISGLFARWGIPRSAFEVYGEWARMALPGSVPDLLFTPYYSGAWTFGFQWAPIVRARSRLRLQTELTDLEQSAVHASRPAQDFYSGAGVEHGYTQRGQIIGAWIGPGASSQSIGIDWIAPSWQVGPYVARVRWENDALYRRPSTYFGHDVSLFAGLRAAVRTGATDLSLDVSTSHRFNYLFQNGIGLPGDPPTIDVHNVSVTLTATPR